MGDGGHDKRESVKGTERKRKKKISVPEPNILIRYGSGSFFLYWNLMDPAPDPSPFLSMFGEQMSYLPTYIITCTKNIFSAYFACLNEKNKCVNDFLVDMK